MLNTTKAAPKTYITFDIVCYWRHHIIQNWKSWVPTHFIQEKNISPSEYRFTITYELDKEIPDVETLNEVIAMIKSAFIGNVISIEVIETIPDIKRSELGTERPFNWERTLNEYRNKE